MDESFQLRATMSPKPLRTKVHLKKPTKLALRKSIRRSSCYDKPPAAVVDILHQAEKLKIPTSDSEYETEFESAESNINNSCVMFADLSIIPKDTEMTAMNSTFIEGRRTMFHELFQSNNKKTSSNFGAVLTKDLIKNKPIETIENKISNPTNKVHENHRDLLISNNKASEIKEVVQKRDESNHSDEESIIVDSSLTPDKEKDKSVEIRDESYKPNFTKFENEILRHEPQQKISSKINRVHKLVFQTEIKKLSPPNRRKLYFRESDPELISRKNLKAIAIPKTGKLKNKNETPGVKVNTSNVKKSKTIKSNVHSKAAYESDSEDDLLTKKVYKRIVTPTVPSLKNKNVSKDKKMKNSMKDLTNTCDDKLIYSIDPEIINITDSDDENLKRKKENIFETTKNSKPLEQITDNVFKKPASNENQTSENTTENDKLDEIRRVLDEVYGASWRENEHEILRTEPRKKKSAETEDVYKAVHHTDIKKIDPNKEIAKKNLNRHLFNENKQKKIYSESPLPNCPKPLKKIERRNLFPSVDSDDEDFKRNLQPTSKTIKKLNVKSKNLESAELKPKCSDKRCAKTLAKYRRIKIVNDSESESADCADSSDSDWDSEDLQKYMKTSEQIQKLSTQKKQRTFLESLSKHVPILEAHPTARIFRNDFKKHRDELASRLFKLFNDDVFNKAIPEDTKLEWNSRLRGTAGYCRNKSTTHKDKKVTRTVSIALSSKVIDSTDRLRDTLVHEMCHAANWMVDGQRGHGPSWRNWTCKARTVFPELPPMGTCHNYNITTKYTYRCKDCGYSFGRHSKSISLEKKCCGYCKGKLELLVNKVSKSGSTDLTPVPATSTRKPTGFALYVKDNYKTCRTPDLNHGDVMRLLSKQFSSVKIDLKN